MILPVQLNNAAVSALLTLESLSGVLQATPPLTGVNTAAGELTGVVGAIQPAIGQVQSAGANAGVMQNIPTQEGQLQEGI